MVQTGANIQLGGLNDGLLIVVYQVLTDSMVNRLPKKPIDNGMAMQIKSGNAFEKRLFFVIFVGYPILTTILKKCL